MQNRNMHISVLNGVLWNMGHVHCGIWEISLLEVHVLTMISVALGVPILPLNVISRQQLSFSYGSYGHVECWEGAGHEDSGGSKEYQI